MREQAINWKKCIGSNQYYDDDFEKWIAFVAKVLFDAFCAVLFVSAARIMLLDVYYWAEYNESDFIELFIIATIISAIMEFAGKTKKGFGFMLQWGVLLVGAGIIINNIWLGEDTDSLLSGLQKIISYYIDDWNSYYNSSIVYETGRLIYVGQSLDFITLVLFFVLFWMTKMLRQNLIMVILPAIVLTLEFLVGYSPDYSGMLQFFVAILISNSINWQSPDFCQAPGRKYISVGSIRFFSWIGVALCIFIISMVIKFTGKSLAEELILYSDDMKSVYNEVVEHVKEMSVWELFDGKGDAKRAQLSNDKPEYEEIDMLKIDFWDKPYNNLYFKHFYADTYKDGEWTFDADGFADECEAAGFDADEISKNIAQLNINQVCMQHEVESIDRTMLSNPITITYLEEKNKKAYVPYFSQINNEEVTVEGDVRYRKSKDLTEMEVVMWKYAGDFRSHLIFVLSSGREDWEKWYEEYINREYLHVPDDLVNVKKIAAELEKEIEDTNLYEHWENSRRIKKADLVAQWMEENTRYSLSLPKLPKGTDPIEYFLGKTKAGYCMHYASASVMILREMGVPARYAAGYIVKPSDIKGTAGNYNAIVKDSAAHAWVEIYLNGIGWVPIEVSKGYSEYVTKPEETTTKAPRPQSTTPPNSATTTKEDVTTESTSAEKETTTKEDETTNNSSEATTGASGGNGQGSGVSIDIIKVLKIFGIIVLLSLIVFGAIRYRESYKERLLSEIKHKRCLSAIKIINRRIYKKLRHTGKVMRFNIRDEEYKKILIENYPEINAEDWDVYMDIVKAAAFSKREFTVEEMNFCYKLYCKVVGE